MTKAPVSASEYELTAASTVSAVCHQDGLTLLDTRTGRLFASNRVGAQIWEGLRRHRAPSEIADEIARDYAISRRAARGDVEAFVGELVGHALLERRIAS